MKLLGAYRLHEEKPSLQKNIILHDFGEKSELKTIFCQTSAVFKAVHPYISRLPLKTKKAITFYFYVWL